MIELKIMHIPKIIALDDRPRLTLVIENKKLYYAICQYMFNDFAGSEEYFTILDDSKPVNMSIYCAFIANVFNLNLNTKKNINALYRLLKKDFYPDFKDDIESLKEKVAEIVKNISVDFEFELSMNSTISEDDIFKIADLRFADSDDTNVARFLKYIFVTAELQNTKVFFVNNMHGFFDKDEINTIYYELNYRGLVLIDIESLFHEEKTDNETVLIIDKDLCTIV